MGYLIHNNNDLTLLYFASHFYFYQLFNIYVTNGVFFIFLLLTWFTSNNIEFNLEWTFLSFFRTRCTETLKCFWKGVSCNTIALTFSFFWINKSYRFSDSIWFFEWNIDAFSQITQTKNFTKETKHSSKQVLSNK